MTDKQKDFIKKICEVLDYDFFPIRNMTTKEAGEWISANIDDYNYAIKEKKHG